MRKLLIFLPVIIAVLALVYLICGVSVPSQLQNLLSGLLGSLIGAFVAAWSTRELIEASVTQDRKRREEEEESRFSAAFAALREEVRINTFPEPPVNTMLATFSFHAWDNFTPYMKKLENDLITLLTRAYSTALAHRTGVSINNIGGPYGGTISQLYEKAVKDFKEINEKLTEVK